MLTECAQLFFDSELPSLLDSNQNLIGFNNGVYDLTEKNFRDGRPDDLIYLSTGIDYVTEAMSDSVRVEIAKLDQFLRQVFPNENRNETDDLSPEALVFLGLVIGADNRGVSFAE